MAVMHSWIRSMEFLFNLACRIKVGHPTTLKSPEFKLKKSVLQTEFKARVGIEVFKVKQGCGSSNDGNTARRFFRHPETPHILGIEREIVESLRDLVEMLNNPKVFPDHIEYQSKAEVLHEMLSSDEYSKFQIAQSVHRLIMHGSTYIRSFNLPLGMLSESGIEARNKSKRRYRQTFALQGSLSQNVKDTYHRLLLTSDPHIFMVRKNKNLL